MTRRALALAASAFVVAAVTRTGGHVAQAETQRDASHVVVRVGEVVVTVGELEDRLDRTPRFQLHAYGTTADAIIRGYVDRVVVPELLFSQEAVVRGLDKSVDIRGQQRGILKGALLRHVRAQVEAEQPITSAEVGAYYAAHWSAYNTPARYAIWRILVSTRDEAAQVIAEAKKDPTPRTWTELARARSLDKSTNLRGGNLGFVAETGESSDAKIKIEPLVLEAVKKVKDGEIVGQPIPEGQGFAVVWRRGSTPATQRVLGEEEPGIRKTLARERAVGVQQKLIADLKAGHLSHLNPAALDLIEVSTSGQIVAKGKAGRIEHRAGAGGPESTPRGLR